LLREIRGEQPDVPVFFAALPECSHAVHLLTQQNMVFMPPAISVESLEKLLFPLGDGKATVHALAAGVMDSQTVVLRRQEYSVEFPAAKEEFEREFFLRVLEREHGNVSRTARVTQITRPGLQLKIQNHRIDLQCIREGEEPGG
jgi:DNA-binding NtrC family response regulator